MGVWAVILVEKFEGLIDKVPCCLLCALSGSPWVVQVSEDQKARGSHLPMCF